MITWVLQENYLLCKESTRTALEEKVEAELALREAEKRGQQDRAVESLRYSYALKLWESHLREEELAFRIYNAALRDEVDRLRKPTVPPLSGHHSCSLSPRFHDIFGSS